MDQSTTYDLLLGLIPALLLGLGGAFVGVGLSHYMAAGLASLASMSVIGYALFIERPTPTPA